MTKLFKSALIVTLGLGIAHFVELAQPVMTRYAKR